MSKNIILYFALIFSLLSCKDKYELQKGIDYEFLKVSGDNQEGIFQHELENYIEVSYRGKQPSVEFKAIKGEGKVYNNHNGIRESGIVHTKWFLGCDSLQTLRAYLYLNQGKDLVDSLDFHAIGYEQKSDWKISCGQPYVQNSYLHDSSNFVCPTFSDLCIGKNGIIYGITWNQVFYSNDEGVSFQQFNTFPENEIVSDIEIGNDETIYVSTQYNGVYRSVNDGFLWEKFNSGLSLPGIVRIKKCNGKIYASGCCGGVFVLENEGESWISFHIDYGDRIIEIIEIAGTLFALTGDHDSTGWKLVFSINGGTSWNLVQEWENRTDIFISGLAVSENGKIYVGVNDSNGGTLFSSDDIGITWVKITNFIEYKFHSGPYIIIPEDDFVYTTNFGYLFKVTPDGNKELIKEDVTTYCIGKYHILISSTYVNGLMYRGK